MKKIFQLFLSIILTVSAHAVEYHVSKSGLDTNLGSYSNPFATISKAAEVAQPGDTITVHAGVYRERINPPRGGTSDEKRIVYRAAPDDEVIIKGSEVVTGWERVKDDVWKVELPNSFFGDFNPYDDLIQGDWFDARQAYHTGAVYLNGHWLKQAPRKSVVTGDDVDAITELELMHLDSLKTSTGQLMAAENFSSQSGGVSVDQSDLKNPNLGPIRNGDWLGYTGVDFGKGSNAIRLWAGSPVGGGIVEIRLGSPDGELLGTADVGLTAEWMHFQAFNATLNQTLSGAQDIALVFKVRELPPQSSEGLGYWFAEVSQQTTTIWAQFKNKDPNQELVEINVRQAVFYPEEPGRDYITVSGFTMEQAATPWSPPTAEQIGLIGTNWSKGWVIEDNIIQYSVCTGLTLGKHGDEYDNASNYNRSIRIAIKEMGWSRDNIGSHLVRNNVIRNCGQAGIVGSMGGAFSTIIGNEIHDIRQEHEYGGCETAGIKLHGAIDVQIIGNHIYRCEHWGGLWLDWMSQGARVSGNLLHDNRNDFMSEMNHGPMLVDNNILLSGRSILDASAGAAYVHNLAIGKNAIWPHLAHRSTPIFQPHSTDVILSPKAAVSQYGAEGGATAAFREAVGNTDQNRLYQTVRYGMKRYVLNAPNGNYQVTLKFNEPHYSTVGARRFDVTIQGAPFANGLDLFARAGKNVAFDLVADDVRVTNGELEIGFRRIEGQPAIAGIEVKGLGTEPFIHRINCGGKALEGFHADYTTMNEDEVKELWDQFGGIGFAIDQNDDRFYNNVFINRMSLSSYDASGFEIEATGNVYLLGAEPTERERNPVVMDAYDPKVKLVEKNGEWWLEMYIDTDWVADYQRPLITTEMLGRPALLEMAAFEHPDGTPYRIDVDYFGNKRNAENPAPGPFNMHKTGKVLIKVWPRQE